MTPYSITRINNSSINYKGDIFYHHIVWDDVKLLFYYFTTEKCIIPEVYPKNVKIIKGSWDVPLDDLLLSSIWGELCGRLISYKYAKIIEDYENSGYSLSPIL